MGWQLAVILSLWDAAGGHAVVLRSNVAEGREMQSVICPP